MTKQQRRKIARPSILPENAAHYEALHTIRLMLDFLWDTWLAEPRSDEERQLACLLVLIAEGGISGEVLECLPSLTPASFHQHHGWVLPVHPKDEGDARAALAFPLTANVLLLSLVAHRASKETTSCLFTILKKHTSTTKTGHTVNAVYRGFAREFKNATGQRAPAWSMYKNVAPLVAWHAGLEPFFLTVQQHVPLPTLPKPGSSPTQITIHAPPAGLRLTHIPPQHRKHPFTGKTHTSIPRYERDDNFAWRAEKMLRGMIRELSIITQRRFKTSHQLERAFQVIEGYLGVANTFAPPSSALHLVLEWSWDKIKKGRTSASSLNTYLERAVFTALLHEDTDSFDLLEWDVEDFQDLVDERLGRGNLSKSTIADVITSFNEIFTYASQHHFAETIDLSDVTEEWVTSAGRTHLVGLGEFEAYLASYQHETDRNRIMQGAMDSIVFYAGLRPNELARLTLQDVFGDETELYLEVHRGKTNASRRRVVFSAIASPAAIELVLKYLRLRQAEFTRIPGRRLSDIAFIGTPANIDPIKSGTISRDISQRLRYLFGDGFVTYHLRHAAASWLFFRLAALRYPTLLESFRDKPCAVFHPAAQARLARYFTIRAADHLRDHDVSPLLLLAKTLAHVSPATTFTYYIHTFPLVQQAAMAQRNDQLGQRTVSGKVIGQLIPGMASRTTQAKLPGKTLADLYGVLSGKTKSVISTA